jgi:hypothetical protein
MPPFAASDLVHRRPVWLALSALYLDTEQTPAMRDADAQQLARSPYTLDDLRAILAREVHPACAANLRSPAGEWAGFDADWLEQRILARAGAVLRWSARFSPLDSAVRNQAEALFARVADIRRTRPAPTV